MRLADCFDAVLEERSSSVKNSGRFEDSAREVSFSGGETHIQQGEPARFADVGREIAVHSINPCERRFPTSAWSVLSSSSVNSSGTSDRIKPSCRI